jgi:transposase
MTMNERAASLSQDEIVELLVSHDELERTVAWYKRQLFGEKSEKRLIGPDGRQIFLGELVGEASVLAATRKVAGYERQVRRSPEEGEGDGNLRFDATVPVEVIEVADPADEAISPETHELVSQKITDRLAQRPGSYVVLRHIRNVWKRKADATLICAPAPAAVLERSIADVSLLAGILIDKFTYHLPLYRQHQRMAAAGVHLTRATLTNWVHRSGDLLEPIYDAQLASILSGDLVTMDETPIRAGRDKPGKMKRGYFWPIYGERDEVAFPFAPTRGQSFIKEVLGNFAGKLLTDGYDPYDRHAAKVNGLVHVLCWSHCRRHFEKAMNSDPALCGDALDRIGKLYEEEAYLKRKDLSPEKRLEHRGEKSKPIVDAFFVWLKEEVERQILLPSHPFLQAARYAMEREAGLRVFLEYPDVPIDTNHLEQQIRPIALGRRNWLFCWTEIGAKYVGIIQSLLATCRLHGVAPYTYLVDVLQRVGDHPASRIAELTPRLWKEHFAANPLPSELDRLRNR